MRDRFLIQIIGFIFIFLNFESMNYTHYALRIESMEKTKIRREKPKGAAIF